MWKKDEEQPATPTAERSRSAATRSTTSSSSAGATIGPSISIRGDVSGSEDLMIHGQVDGSVTLGLHSVSVGSKGRVNADITGRTITIEGHVEGDLTAEEQIVLLGTAKVQGDIRAPRVVLEDGATFRGLVDMGSSRTETKAKAEVNGATATTAEPETKATKRDDKAAKATSSSTSSSSSSSRERSAGASIKASGRAKH